MLTKNRCHLHIRALSVLAVTIVTPADALSHPVLTEDTLRHVTSNHSAGVLSAGQFHPGVPAWGSINHPSLNRSTDPVDPLHPAAPTNPTTEALEGLEEAVIDDLKANLTTEDLEGLEEAVIDDLKANPTTEDLEGLEEAVIDDLKDVFHWRMRDHRKHRTPKHPASWQSAATIFQSASFYLWFMFFAVFFSFVVLHFFIISQYPLNEAFNSLLVVSFWFAVAALFWFMIYQIEGKAQAEEWVTGYVMEITFAIENVFAFLAVVEAFKTPARITSHALSIVVVVQVGFQAVLYLGLAGWLRSLEPLPYVLGAWLIFFGFCSLRTVHDDHEEDENTPVTTGLVRWFKNVLGNRLSLGYEGRQLFVQDLKGEGGAPTRDAPMQATLLIPVVLCLLVTDSLLEVDITLAKIEQLSSPYNAFTSSALAAFAVPEFFFVVQALFIRFSELKIGVCLILMFFGATLLIEDIYALPPSAECCIVVSTILVSMLISEWRRFDPNKACCEDAASPEIAAIWDAILKDVYQASSIEAKTDKQVREAGKLACGEKLA